LPAGCRWTPPDAATSTPPSTGLVRHGDVLINRKGQLCIARKLDLISGTVQGHPDGFGFLVPDAGGDDLFLSPKEMHKVLHGDRATGRQVGTDRRGRPEGEIVNVLERANREIVGRLHEERGVWFVVAENRRINQDLLVPADERGGARAGQGRRRGDPRAAGAGS
jgi:ribonuclease R